MLLGIDVLSNPLMQQVFQDQNVRGCVSLNAALINFV
jgi:hypothetical protein